MATAIENCEPVKLIILTLMTELSYLVLMQQGALSENLKPTLRLLLIFPSLGTPYFALRCLFSIHEKRCCCWIH